MSENTLQFDATEAQIVARAANSAVTRRRILYSVLAPVVLIALVLAIFWRDAQPRTLLWIFVGYVAINMLEKIGYGLAVLSYKSVIRKLLSRVRELEGPPTAG
jgi:uncharacterized membrane protein